MKKILLNNKKLYVLVDDKDFDFLNQWKWHCTSAGYAARSIYLGHIQNKRKVLAKRVLMHRQIMGFVEGVEIDHIDGNKLNNQKNNLRFAMHGDNMHNHKGLPRHNTSGYIGVYFYKKTNNWKAQIRNKGRQIFLGTFKTAKEASEARDKFALKLHGKFATLNKGKYLGEYDESEFKK